MDALRTPETRFENLPDYPFLPHYADVDNLRMHYVDEGPPDGPVVLLLHGEPSWSYLYRHMIPPLANAGLRTIAPDLIGFGKSDKPARASDYSYASHVAWMHKFIDGLKQEWFAAGEEKGIYDPRSREGMELRTSYREE